MILEGKAALVTGGSRGIGRAIALRLAAMGARVAINYVSKPDAAQEVVDAIKAAGGDAGLYKFDVADATAVNDGVSNIIEDFGRLDILVNNAGITRDSLLMKMKEESWDQVLDTNLKGAYNCIKAVNRPMMKQRWGRIINISSVIGFLGNAGQANYAAAKAGLTGLTRSVARELASRNITVNGVAPGYIDTDMTRDLGDEVKEKVLGEIPMRAMGSVEDVAGAVAYLASDDARYVTGQFIHVNGGMFMG
ncbi:MAG: 3-oxoacyl-[acyl-carrier-protein] reductase [Desulfobulbaceae bacterium]|nr:3-oxoacyl-[acyl-carrier-protein] reductase [Desulfobulbaceae bacterium]